jgi:hypothetical protein
MTKQNNDSSANAAAKAQGGAEPEYKVGPGRPPKEYQFKPGQSGNPKGAKRKKPTIDLDLKAALECALKRSATLKQGDKERTVTMAEAGIEQLVAKFVKGDRDAGVTCLSSPAGLASICLPSKQSRRRSPQIKRRSSMPMSIDSTARSLRRRG